MEFQDLKPLNKKSVKYQLSILVGQLTKQYILKEGDSYIGCDIDNTIIIENSNIRKRHLRIKLHGDSIFIEALHGSKVLYLDMIINSLIKVSLSEPFYFGDVKASIIKISNQDLSRAISIDTKNIIKKKKIKVLQSSFELIQKNFLQQNKEEALLQSLITLFSPLHLQLKKTYLHDIELICEYGSPPLTSSPSDYHQSIIEGEGFQLLVDILLPHNDYSKKDIETIDNILLLYFVSRSKNEKVKLLEVGYFSWNRLIGNFQKKQLQLKTDLVNYSEAVLILGETGTGKELIAQSLHDLWSTTRKGQYIALNCAAIPSELLEAELFGTVAGTATGVGAREGRIKQAEGGTIFLDEIAELPLVMQSKLLRVLQERTYYKVGGTNLEKADIKVVAATNKTQTELLSGKVMRNDLFFRLSQAIIELLPLNQRTIDLPSLIKFFLTELEIKYSRNIIGVSLSCLESLKLYEWPGNIRELQNVLRQLYFSTQENTLIQSIYLPKYISQIEESNKLSTLASKVEVLERKLIIEALEQFSSMKDSASYLGLSEGYLYRKLKKLDITKK